MPDNKSLLLKIYEEAKQKRLVLNQDEFARLLGKSRVHLFKNMKTIPDSLIEKAQELVSKQTKREGTIEELLRDLDERIIRLESLISVLLQTQSNEIAERTGRQSSLIASELQKAAAMVSELRLSEQNR